MAEDPRCPECGGPVGTTATYCMHCDVEFARPTDSDQESVTGTENPQTERQIPGIGTIERLLEDWLAPDGWLDDSLTIVIGVLAGVIAGFLALLVVGVIAGGTAGVVAGLGAWLGTTGSLAKRHTVFGAIRGACYAVAGLLVLVPLIALTDAAKGGSVAGQVLLFVIGELLFGLVALALVGIGSVAGRKRPSADG